MPIRVLKKSLEIPGSHIEFVGQVMEKLEFSALIVRRERELQPAATPINSRPAPT